MDVSTIHAAGLLTILSLMSSTEGARILSVLAFPGKSHHIVIQPILEALADAGHEVVVYTPISRRQPYPNYMEVVLDNILPIQSGGASTIENMIKLPPWKFLQNLFFIYEDVLSNFLQHEKINRLIQSKEHFDLVITESFFAQEFTLLFGHVFRAPTIVIHTFATTGHINMNMGNVLTLASVPDCCSSASSEMSLGERIVNVLCVLRGMYLYYNYHLPTVETMMKEHVPDVPPLREMIENVSLVFTSDHLTTDYGHPRPANMIPVGGIHIRREQPLPRDLQEFMDGAEHGVILLSMGSVVPDDSQPKEYYDTFVNVFKKLRQRVLWKTSKKTIEGLTDNVKLGQWLPQRDILAHPKCVLYITHGGMASLQEAVTTGVPTVTIPYLGDQYRNAGYYRALQVGLVVRRDQLGEETMVAAIEEVLGNPKYKANMVRLSRVFQDRPMTPAETVVYWTEYVLRHGGAPHLKPASARLSWYQFALLDVAGVLLAGAVVITGMSCVVVMMVRNKLRRVPLGVKARKKTN